MGKTTRIVLVGAGYGGILTAKKLARKLKKDDVEINIIDRNSYHTMLTELHEVAAGRVPEDAIRIHLKKIFAGRNVNVILDEVTSVDYDQKVVKSANQEYPYDYLVIGTGSKPTHYGVKGASEFSKPLWSFEDAVHLREHILTMFRKASVEKDPALRKRMLSFVVVGAGFTGVEMAGELGEWKNRLCKEFNIEKEDVNIYNIDMLPSVLPTYPVKLISKAEKRLKKLGVTVISSTGITEVTDHDVCLNEKECLETNTVIWAAGVESADLSANSGLKTEARGRIVTNQWLQAEEHEDVYVVGDNIFYVPEGHERPVPQMVENAEHSASTVAHNILSDIKGGERKPYKPAFHGSMVCIGGGYGVAHVGTDKRMFAFSGFLAMFIKHFINVIYFLQVAGFNKIWTYMMHEVFHVPDRRSLLGGHFSKASPNFWLVPLRVFLGYKWFEQGWHKLPSILEDPSNIFLIPAKVSATSGASEAWEGGAEAAETAVEATTAASQAVEGAAEAASQWGQALPVPEFIGDMVQWSMDLMFYTPDGGFTVMAQIFQAVMVVGEIVVGLCLIAGLFTALASVASIVMGAMIWVSGMAPLEMLWYMSGGVATIGGSGSTLGMDYYVLPWLKNWWKKTKFARKTYLYTD